MQFTQNPAVSEPRPGGKLMMFGGMIDGEYVKVETNKKLQMKWRFKDWGEQYADVNITFEDDEDDVSCQLQNQLIKLFESYIFSVICFQNILKL